MAENSSIEWTDHTFNPWRGCTKVHGGCTNCYAEVNYSVKMHGIKWGPTGTRVVAAESGWQKPVTWNKQAEAAGERRKVFCASLADVFEDWDGPMRNAQGQVLLKSYLGDAFDTYDDWKTPWEELGDKQGWQLYTMDDVRRRLFALIDATPWIDWIIPTKRPENAPRMWLTRAGESASAVSVWSHRHNVWLLTSVSDQASADKQIPELLKCRDLAPVLGISAEPLLGPIDLAPWVKRSTQLHMSLSVSGALRNKSFDGFTDGNGRPLGRAAVEAELRIAEAKGIGCLPMGDCDNFDPQTGCRGHRNPSLDWVIVGGESGHHARPMHPDWVRSIRSQCTAAGVAFFFKQWGDLLPACEATIQQRSDGILRERQFPSPHNPDKQNTYFAVGKKAAGRTLDGRQWSEFPEGGCSLLDARCSRSDLATSNEQPASTPEALP